MAELIDKGGYYVADNAVVCGDVSCGKGVNIWFGAVVRGDIARISIGEYTNVQDLAVLHVDPDKDLEIGQYVTIGHSALIHGSTIGEHCLIGMGAILLSGSVIGEGSIIGAGAVVRENQIIPPHSIVVGIPAVVKKKTADGIWDEHHHHAYGYYECALRYVNK